MTIGFHASIQDFKKQHENCLNTSQFSPYRVGDLEIVARDLITSLQSHGVSDLVIMIQFLQATELICSGLVKANRTTVDENKEAFQDAVTVAAKVILQKYFDGVSNGPTK